MMEFIRRALTSIVLFACIVFVLLFFTAIQMAIAIAFLYGYAFFIEYIPLVRRSFSKIPVLAGLTGVALVTTGVLHIFWAYNPDTRFYVILCIATAVLSDVSGYIVGKIVGMHLFVPSISPKKTWEGVAGSIVITSSCFVIFTFDSYWTWFFGVLLAIAALGGDLLFSYIKRAAGVKDTGNILPGHGGILDRLDSIVGTTILFLIFLLCRPG